MHSAFFQGINRHPPAVAKFSHNVFDWLLLQNGPCWLICHVDLLVAFCRRNENYA